MCGHLDHYWAIEFFPQDFEFRTQKKNQTSLTLRAQISNMKILMFPTKQTKRQTSSVCNRGEKKLDEQESRCII
jgi:hypothetical protein